MNRRTMKKLAGMLALSVVLGGCSPAGGSGQADIPETTQAAETEAKETTEASETAGTTAGAAAEETTEAAAEETAGGETAAPAQTEETQTGETAEAVSETDSPVDEAAASLSDIYSQIEQQVALNSPMTVPAEFISNYFGIDVSSAEDYLFVMSEMATSAETIVIVKTGGEDRQAAVDSLQTVIDQKAAEMENYLPDQYDIVSKSTVHQTGDYVWMVISENADAIGAIIEAGLQ